MSSMTPVAVAALTLATAFAPLTAAVAAPPSIGDPVFVDDHVKQPRGDKPVGPRPVRPPPEDLAPPERDAAAEAAARPGRTPAPAVGPRLAALIAPNGASGPLAVIVERATGVARAYKPALGFYCIVPKRGIPAAPPSLTVDYTSSRGENNVVRWASEPTALGCKAGEIGAMTFEADQNGAYRLTDRVGFAIVA